MPRYGVAVEPDRLTVQTFTQLQGIASGLAKDLAGFYGPRGVTDPVGLEVAMARLGVSPIEDRISPDEQGRYLDRATGRVLVCGHVLWDVCIDTAGASAMVEAARLQGRGQG